MIEIDPGYLTNEKTDILRCLEILYGTREGEQAQERSFGLSQEWLDLPIEAAKAAITSEIIEKTARYEPRVRVREVTFSGDASTGQLIPKVVIENV